VALAYHLRYTTDPESVKALPNGEAWLASDERVMAVRNVEGMTAVNGEVADFFVRTFDGLFVIARRPSY
jgi:hypothetical protein